MNVQTTTPLHISEESIPNIGFESGKYFVRFAENWSEIKKALKLRYQVFCEELGAELTNHSNPSMDYDIYDDTCHHLIILERDTNNVIGTYRLQHSRMAEHSRGFYTAKEFSIHLFSSDILLNSIELGRACIHKNHRNGRVLYLLWKGIAAYIQQTGTRYLFGCCSISSDDTYLGWQIWDYLYVNGHMHGKYSLPVESYYECIRPESSKQLDSVKLPDLFNLYLQIGAKVCSYPALDSQFHTIDYLILLDINELNKNTKSLFFG